jgi:hypothetical protein
MLNLKNVWPGVTACVALKLSINNFPFRRLLRETGKSFVLYLKLLISFLDFLQLADSALKLSEAQRRDNSMAIDRFRPKIRAAKKAGKLGEFEQAISLLKEAKDLMKPATASWDGVS